MLDVIVGDCEVFKHYFLFVAKTLPDGQLHVMQSKAELEQFYNQHRDAIWCFYNSGYDQYIIKAVLLGKDPKPVSDFIVREGNPGYKYSPDLNKIELNCFDIQQQRVSLKVLEAFMGEDIRETTVSFGLDRELTPEEKDQVIYYCKHDVEMAFKVLEYNRPTFVAKLGLCRTFDLPLSNMGKTAARLALSVLGAKEIDPVGEFDLTFPNTLELSKYAHIRKWFEDQCKQGAKGKAVYQNRLEATVAGCPCVFAWGGLHGALPCYHSDGCIVGYDVASLYPSLMIKYNYFSRGLLDPSKYTKIYHDRIEHKRNGDPKANAEKLVLNSTYGTYKDKFAASYDPQAANNICAAGQLLLLDLVEHIECNSCAKLIQVNTDGVFYEIADQFEADKLDAVVSAWEQRTGLNMERSEWQGIHQRDVNNYILIGKDGKDKGKGALKKLSPIDYDLPIINEALRAYFSKGISIEETIKSCNDYAKFQKVFKLQGKYTYVCHNEDTFTDIKVFRVFASNKYSDSTLYKGYEDTLEVFAGCPMHCYIENDRILDKEIPKNLDRGWYITEAKRRLTGWYDNVPLLEGLV